MPGNNKFSQMVVKDGDESHGTIHKKITNKTNPRHARKQANSVTDLNSTVSTFQSKHPQQKIQPLMGFPTKILVPGSSQ